MIDCHFCTCLAHGICLVLVIMPVQACPLCSRLKVSLCDMADSEERIVCWHVLELRAKHQVYVLQIENCMYILWSETEQSGTGKFKSIFEKSIQKGGGGCLCCMYTIFVEWIWIMGDNNLTGAVEFHWFKWFTLLDMGKMSFARLWLDFKLIEIDWGLTSHWLAIKTVDVYIEWVWIITENTVAASECKNIFFFSNLSKSQNSSWSHKWHRKWLRWHRFYSIGISDLH